MSPPQPGSEPADRRRFLRAAAGATLAGAGGAMWSGPAAADDDGDISTWHGPDVQRPDLATDPTKALRRALAQAAGAGGGTVLVAPGRHELTGDLEVPDNVTLLGAGRTRTVLAGAGITHVAGVRGATVEDLTVDGAGTGIRYRGGASFCVLRRLLVSRSVGTGIWFEGGGYEHLMVDDVRVDHSGNHGFDFGATDPCHSVFVAGLAVGRFGHEAPGSAAVRVAGRCHLNQLHLAPVEAGTVALRFEPGSEHTTVSNYYLGLDGGRAAEGDDLAHLGVGTTQDLTA